MLDLRHLAAAAALAVATPALPQSDQQPPYQPPTQPTPPAAKPPGPLSRPGAATPAPAPSQQAPATTPGTPQQGAQPALSADQKSALGAVWAHNQLQAGLGDLAASRGGSEEVKNFARWVANDQRNLGTQLTTRLQERGASTSELPSPGERGALDQEVKALGGRSGEDFDRAFVTFYKQRGPTFVEALKRARDLTAGSDATLKKFLDQAEDAQEAYLTAARQLDARRAQARTPPKK